MDKTQQQLPILESRRAFLGHCAALAGLGAMGCLGALVEGCSSSVAPVDYTPVAGVVGANSNELIFDVSSLDTDGAWLVSSQKGVDGRPMMVIRESAGSFKTLSMQCTHENNPVNPPVDGVITCPYHGSQFTLTGAVKSGPARSSLRSYATSFDASTNKVTVTVR